MKITAFNGSPRKNGNTRLLIEKMLLNSNDKEIIDLNDLNIRGCQACGACKTNGNICVLNDDMPQIHKKILASDMIILGTPVYMWQMSAQAKLFSDRLYNFFNGRELPSVIKGKKMILLFTHGNPNAGLFSEYFRYVRKAFSFLGFDVVETLVASGIRTPGEVMNNQVVMEKVKEINSKLVSGM